MLIKQYLLHPTSRFNYLIFEKKIFLPEIQRFLGANIIENEGLTQTFFGEFLFEVSFQKDWVV